MKKIPHKGEVYPKVEMEGSSTPKIAYAQSRVGPCSSNSHVVMRKIRPRSIYEKKTGFRNRAFVLVKEIAHMILLTKREVRFLLLS